MILVIDVGNTNIVIGAYEKDKLLKTFRLSTIYERSSDEIGMMMCSLLEFNKIDVKKIDSAIVSSVVPQVMFSLERAISLLFTM